MLASLSSWTVFIILILPIVCLGSSKYGPTVGMMALFVWLFIVGIAINKVNVIKSKIKFNFFIFCILYSIAFQIINKIFIHTENDVITIFQYLLIISIFYPFLFVSQSLVFAEEKKRVKVNRYIGTFILFWLFPIGVWFLQPRIKAVLEEK